MNKKIVSILGIILSVTVLLYFESFMYKVINVVGINLNNYSNMVIIIIDIIIKFIMCFIIYYIYKKDFRRRHSRDNILKSLIFFIIYLVVLALSMSIFKYIIDFIADIFDITIISQDFYNIFNKKLDFSLIVKILSDYIISPYLYCSIILLSVDKLCKRNDTFYILCGILASIIYAFNLSGTLIYVIINSLYMFILFIILSIIYKRENNIWFIVFLYGAYLISNIIIINYLGW